MGAWIEIVNFSPELLDLDVAPHDGCVDWNFVLQRFYAFIYSRTPRWVRGLKSSVCWRMLSHSCRTPRWVRGLKSAESSACAPKYSRTPRWVRASKSNRGRPVFYLNIVAPHDGCVDWNNVEILGINGCIRRTPRWVRGLKSSYYCQCMHYMAVVAPHDGCVDWNLPCIHIRFSSLSRTPRWVRGLKSWIPSRSTLQIASHPTMGAWIEM